MCARAGIPEDGIVDVRDDRIVIHQDLHNLDYATRLELFFAEEIMPSLGDPAGGDR